MRTLSLRFVLPALLCAVLPGLSASGCTNLSCTDIAFSSVIVTVLDMNRVPVTDAMLTFTVDGGPVQACNSGVETGTYACGVEVPGHFVITGSRGGMTGMGEADVSADACHVHTVMLTIQLQ
jgi:hypothetical protein